MTAFALVAAVLLVIANGAFVALEFALVGSRRGAISQLAAEGRRSAIAAERLQDNLALMLAGAQLGITVCSLALGRLAEPAVAHLLESVLDRWLSDAALHTVAFVIALSIVVFAHILFGEMVPKNLTLAGTERSLLFLAIPMSWYYVIAKPIMLTLQGVGNAILRVFGFEVVTSLADAASTAELDLMLAESHEEGLIDTEERALLGGALRFGATPVSSVMTPMDDVDLVRTSDAVADIVETFDRTGHARLIVCGDRRDDVRGFVHSKDLLALPERSLSRFLPVGSVRPMVRVDADAALSDVLRRMQAGRAHLAAVVDAGGRSVGVATLDDVFRGLVGDLSERGT